MSPRLSVLDLVPVRTGQTTTQALEAATSLARTAEQSGFERYWTAEHHNMPAVAATVPSLILMHVGRGTERIRLGSGGVMLPNSTPLDIAEQFALLDAVHPGRVDLGLGRAPGTDPITAHALRPGESMDAAVERFPESVVELAHLLSPDGLERSYGARRHSLHPAPTVGEQPEIWLLGSSAYSAQLAAGLGMRFAFAHHFAGVGTESALRLYREGFTARPELAGTVAEPTALITVNACVAETQEQADLLAEPHALSMARLRGGGPLAAQLHAGAEVRRELTPELRESVSHLMDPWIVGTPEASRERLDELAQRMGVEEIMVHPVAGAESEDPLDRYPARERTLELLADA